MPIRQFIIIATGASSINFATDPRFGDFNITNNTIEMIGAGGNGALPTGNGNAVKGGGGGQYAKIINFNPAGGTFNYQIGIGGGSVGSSVAPGTADSWFGNSNTTLYAQGGTSAPDGVTGGSIPGGQAPAVGSSIVFNGGNGGGNSLFGGGAAGGGAGGPNGAGGLGHSGLGNGGFSGGGAGGYADNNLVPGGLGGLFGPGSNGNTGNEWGGNFGCGSGGGGGAYQATGGYSGGNGGIYGGGGGAAGYNFSGSRGLGGQGILVITWPGNNPPVINVFSLGCWSPCNNLLVRRS